jgi:hypothetical protein
MKTLDLNAQIRDHGSKKQNKCLINPLLWELKLPSFWVWVTTLTKIVAPYCVTPTPPSTHNFPEKFNKYVEKFL